MVAVNPLSAQREDGTESLATSSSNTGTFGLVRVMKTGHG